MKLLATLLCLATPALAYNEKVHAAITERAFAEAPAAWRTEALTPPTAADLDAFRAQVGRALGHPELADAWAFKEFFMLDPAARVHGIDLTGDERPMPRLELLALASRWPDDDRRNQNRFQRDGRHEIARGSDGQPLPDDPATLDFGALTGTSSQAHAHYGLVEGELSDDPDVLKKDPARFAVPRTAHATGAEMAELYTDLAQLAAQSGLPSAGWLEAAFAGAAFHHLQDVCNQIHTVQVGIYEFFQSAFLQSKLRDVTTLGGLLGARRSLKDVGLRLIKNHHLMSEDLFARHLAEARDLGDDAALIAAATPRMQGAPGRGLAQALIDASSREGPEVYRLAWQFSAPTLRDGLGHEYEDGKDDPAAFVAPGHDAQVQQFFALQARGVRRAATALRLWARAAREGDAAKRLAAILEPYQPARLARRAQYAPQGPERLGIAWGYPLAALAVVLLVGWLIARRALRRGQSRGHAAIR